MKEVLRDSNRNEPPLSFRVALKTYLFGNTVLGRNMTFPNSTFHHLGRRADQVWFGPLVYFALLELGLRVNTYRQYLAPSAIEDLAQHLLDRLGMVLAPTCKVLGRGILIPKDTPGPSTGCNKNTRINLDTASQLLIRFPAVAETVALLLWDWIHTHRELLSRLHEDKKKLCRLRRSNRASFRVKHIRPGLSDYHETGGSVVLLTFMNGEGVIYKPRRSDGEVIWFRILKWLNREGFGACFYVPEFVSRKNYYWMTFVKSRDCRDTQELRRFYRRWGAQAAVATLFSFGDLHHENWIAAGGQPVLVDAEVFGGKHTALDETHIDACQRKLLATGLLPFTPSIGLSYRGIAPFDTPERFARTPACWPRCRHKTRPPIHYVDDIVRGFRSLIRFVVTSKTVRCIDRFPTALRALESRLIYRSTSEYAEMLRLSLEPRAMLLGPSRYSRLLVSCSQRARSAKIARCEARALARCCIPRFTYRVALRRSTFSRLRPNHFGPLEERWARFLGDGLRLCSNVAQRL
jgi:hypothetical protein